MEQEKAKLNKGKAPCMWQGESMQQKNPDGLRWKSGNLGHLGGILDSDASAGAARAVHRTAAASGSLSSRLDSYAFIAPKLKQTETKRTQEFAPESTEVCPEVDSLVHQLATGKGEFFDYVDALNPQVGCVMCMRDLHETALYEGRHEVKVLPCFHSVCAACLQSLLASSDGDAFDCPRCGRRTQKMQALHQYLPNFDMLHDIDGQKVAQSDFLCEECTSGYRYLNELGVISVRGSLHRPQGAEVRNIHRAQYCAIHRTSRYELYCEDCERLICNECARHDHQQCSYRLPSASLIEKHRQRSSEMACMQARSNISAAFDELNRAAELRCAELLQHVQENGRQPLSALLAEKERCSAALVDVWCVIDFMEKVNKHGTDVEVLMAKSHLFRDPIGSQKFQEWQNLVAAPLPGFERSRATWREAVQRRLTSRVVRLDATENVIEKAGKAAM
eukprot:g12281.t1